MAGFAAAPAWTAGGSRLSNRRGTPAQEEIRQRAETVGQGNDNEPADLPGVAIEDAPGAFNEHPNPERREGE